MLSTLYRSVAEAWAALRAPAASSDPPPREASLVAVVRPGRLGDLLLTDPLLAALEERFPGAAIELLVDAADAVPPWLEENPRLRVRRLEVRRGPDAWLRPGSPAFEAGMEALEGAWEPEGPGVVLFADPLAGPVRGHLAARISRAAPGAWRAGLVPGGSPRRFLHRSVEPPEGHEIVRLLALIPMEEYVGVPTISPLVIGVTVTLLGTIGLAAGFFPARQAARLDPAECIRDG